jgi:CubicO group peptidase (beta-lactamase class C family)
MSSLEIRTDPSAMGMDGPRLERIRDHFDRYVGDGRLSGWLVSVARAGELVWTGSGGYRDREAQLAVTDDTLWRIYSMTKPLTTLGAMMLYEEGRFDLNDDVGRWIDSLAEPQVYVSGKAAAPVTVPATSPVRVHHLHSHTSGLTYGFTHLHPVAAI